MTTLHRYFGLDGLLHTSPILDLLETGRWGIARYATGPESSVWLDEEDYEIDPYEVDPDEEDCEEEVDPDEGCSCLLYRGRITKCDTLE